MARGAPSSRGFLPQFQLPLLRPTQNGGPMSQGPSPGSRASRNAVTARRQRTGATNCTTCGGEVCCWTQSCACNTQLLPSREPAPQRHPSSQFASVFTGIPNSCAFITELKRQCRLAHGPDSGAPRGVLRGAGPALGGQHHVVMQGRRGRVTAGRGSSYQRKEDRREELLNNSSLGNVTSTRL